MEQVDEGGTEDVVTREVRRKKEKPKGLGKKRKTVNSREELMNDDYHTYS